jgi:hypothetical protein
MHFELRNKAPCVAKKENNRLMNLQAFLTGKPISTHSESPKSVESEEGTSAVVFYTFKHDGLCCIYTVKCGCPCAFTQKIMAAILAFTHQFWGMPVAFTQSNMVVPVAFTQSNMVVPVSFTQSNMVVTDAFTQNIWWAHVSLHIKTQ